MHSKHMDNQRGALVWFGIILLLTSAQTAALILSGPNATAVGAIPFAIVGYLMLLLLLIVPLGLRGLDAALRGAAAGDSRRAPLAFGQLTPVGALAPGETLTLTRTLQGGALARVLTTYGLAFALLVALPFILQAVTATSLAGLLPLGVVWLLILVIYFGRAVRVVLVSRHVQVTADDRGITTKVPLHRARFIAWDDIRVVVRTSGAQGSAIGGSFFLLGQTNALGFTLQGLELNRNAPARYVYSGGPAPYPEQAQRLLATIAARSQAPLRVQASGYYGRVTNRAFPLFGLNATDVQALPPAHPAFQPSLAGMQAAPMQTQPVTLRAKGSANQSGSAGSLIARVLVLAFVILLFYQLAMLAGIPGQTMSTITLVTTLFFPFLFIFIIIILLALRSGTSNRAITVDATGITGTPMVATFNPVHIPWPAVRAWVVLPPSPKIPAATYAIFSNGPTIVWQESPEARLAGPVPGDRTAAFRVQADILRAIIATRSGQILRQAQPRG